MVRGCWWKRKQAESTEDKAIRKINGMLQVDPERLIKKIMKKVRDKGMKNGIVDFPNICWKNAPHISLIVCCPRKVLTFKIKNYENKQKFYSCLHILIIKIAIIDLHIYFLTTPADTVFPSANVLLEKNENQLGRLTRYTSFCYSLNDSFHGYLQTSNILKYMNILFISLIHIHE